MKVNYLAFGMQNLSRDKGFGMPGRKGNSGDYKYGFNGMENDHEIKGDGNHLDFGARGYDPRLGRWHTPDAHESNYPSHSSYHFAYNNPNLFVDPDGNDNVIYLVAMSSAQGECLQEVADHINVFFSSMENVKTKAVVFNTIGEGSDAEYDPRGIDKTDATIYIGSPEEIVNHLKSIYTDSEKYKNEIWEIWKFQNWEGDKYNPETTAQTYLKAIGISPKGAHSFDDSYNKDANDESKKEAIALFGFHGTYHIATGSAEHEYDNSAFGSGNRIKPKIQNGTSYNELGTNEDNKEQIEYFHSKYGNNDPKVNYRKKDTKKSTKQEYGTNHMYGTSRGRPTTKSN